MSRKVKAAPPLGGGAAQAGTIHCEACGQAFSTDFELRNHRREEPAGRCRKRQLHADKTAAAQRAHIAASMEAAGAEQEALRTRREGAEAAMLAAEARLLAVEMQSQGKAQACAWGKGRGGVGGCVHGWGAWRLGAWRLGMHACASTCKCKPRGPRREQ